MAVVNCYWGSILVFFIYLPLLQLYLRKCFCKGIVDRFVRFFCLFSQIIIHIFFAGAFSRFFLPVFESA